MEITREPATMPPRIRPTACYAYEQLLQDLDRLCAAHPGEAAWEAAGLSAEGRTIPVLRLGQVDAKRQVLLQGAIHAREHMTAWLLMSMADVALNQGLPEGICWHIFPMMNPDGVRVSQSGTLNEVQAAIYQRDLAEGRTELPPLRYAQRWKANGFGVDLNRCFPSGWEPVNGPKEPSSERYKGEVPFDAPEVRLLRDYTLRHSFDVTLSYHATGSVLYYEFGARQPVNADSLSLGQAVSAVTGYPLVGCDSLEGAGYKDWVMEELGIPSLTVEIGRGEAPLGEEELTAVYAENKNVLSAVARWLEERENGKCPSKK